MTDPGPTEWGETAGVGPWQGPGPADARYDSALRRDGDTNRETPRPLRVQPLDPELLP